MIKKIIAFLFLVSSLNVLAQKNNASPYSFFGIGEQTGTKTVQETGMGGISGAYNSFYQLNLTNPASYSFLQLTSFNVAAEYKGININDGTNSASSSSTSFSYLALGFPVGKNAGLAFGLKPNTSVGYSLKQQIRDTNNSLTAINLFSGEGGTNSVFLGFAHKIGSNFSIGLESSYIFGSIENSLFNRINGVPLATMQKSESKISGFIFKGGLQYSKKMNEKLTVKAGIVVESNSKITNRGKEYRYSTLNLPNPSPSQSRDTTLSRAFEVKFKNPLKNIISAGIGESNKWYAGVEYEFSSALKFEDGFDQNNSTYSYTSANRISVGGFYTPKPNSVSSYWQRATYRAGLNIKKTGLVVNNTSINDFGMNFGIALPMGKQLSSIDLGFEFGKRGKATDGLIKENYFNLRVGLSLTDKWFNKIKLN